MIRLKTANVVSTTNQKAVILCAMILLLFGIVTIQQILNFKASNPSPPPIVENAENVNVKKEDEN